jgi:hypothetical protein
MELAAGRSSLREENITATTKEKGVYPTQPNPRPVDLDLPNDTNLLKIGCNLSLKSQIILILNQIM